MTRLGTEQKGINETVYRLHSPTRFFYGLGNGYGLARGTEVFALGDHVEGAGWHVGELVVPVCVGQDDVRGSDQEHHRSLDWSIVLVEGDRALDRTAVLSESNGR